MRILRLVVLGMILAGPGLLWAADAPAPAAPTYVILRTDKGDDATVQVVTSDLAKTTKDKIHKDAKAALDSWQKAYDDFQKHHAPGQKFTRKRPDDAKVSTVKDGIATKAEADKLAADEQAKADGTFAVVRITTDGGRESLEVLLDKKVRERQSALYDQYESRLDNWKAAHGPAASKPKEPSVKVLKTGVATKADAQKAMEEIRKADEKK